MTYTTNNIGVRKAKSQISLGMRPDWSESLLCAQWVTNIRINAKILCADNTDSDQSEVVHRLIWVFSVRTATLLYFSCRGSLLEDERCINKSSEHAKNWCPGQPLQSMPTYTKFTLRYWKSIRFKTGVVDFEGHALVLIPDSTNLRPLLLSRLYIHHWRVRNELTVRYAQNHTPLKVQTYPAHPDY